MVSYNPLSALLQHRIHHYYQLLPFHSTCPLDNPSSSLRFTAGQTILFSMQLHMADVSSLFINPGQNHCNNAVLPYVSEAQISPLCSPSLPCKDHCILLVLQDNKCYQGSWLTFLLVICLHDAFCSISWASTFLCPRSHSLLSWILIFAVLLVYPQCTPRLSMPLSHLCLSAGRLVCLHNTHNNIANGQRANTISCSQTPDFVIATVSSNHTQ